MNSKPSIRSSRRARSHRLGPGFALKALPLAAALCCTPALYAQVTITGAAGLPQGGTVAAGDVTGGVSGNKMTLTQAGNRAVIDWQSFNINAGKEVQFVQPSASAAVLNRVSASAGMSEIYGSLSANGTVLLMNPNGVLFGAGSYVNVGSLIATTGTVDEAQFKGGKNVAISNATTGSVVNQGTITASDAGLVALVAPSVSNHGVIAASGGTVLLAGASTATVSLNGGLFEFATGGAGASVRNSGTIQADGGTVILTAAGAGALVDSVINMDGVIQARSIGMRDGAIVLDGGDTGGVRVSGHLDATGTAGRTGGTITVTGGDVKVEAGARLDASGDAGGGTVLVGGNWQGRGPERNARTTTIAAGATLKADAVSDGNGGKVVVWADDTTRFNGAISARGGAAGGDGGMVEVSGKRSLGFDGAVDTSAPLGKTGSLLLDPAYAIVSTDPSGTSGDTQTINAAALVSSLNTSNITVQADTLATVNAAVNASGNTNAHNLAFNAPTIDLNAAITLKAGANLSGTASTVNVNGVNARIQNGVDVAASGATVNVAAGTYAENLSITKALTLDGAGVGLTTLQSSVTGEGNAVTVNGASGVTLSDFSIDNYAYGLRIDGTSHNVTVNRLALNNNTSGLRTGTSTRADNFRMLNSTITGGQIGVQTYNNYTTGSGSPVATGSFSNALFENVTVNGPSFKGFYFETANNLTLRDVTVTNAGNYGAPASSSQHRQYGSAIDINLKYDAYNAVNLENVVVSNSGYSSGDSSRAAIVIKTRGIPGDSASYTPAPASLQSVNITGGSITGSNGVGLRVETLRNGAGGQPTVTLSGGTQFGNNGQDIVVDNTWVDARGAVFTGAANGFAIEDRVTHALDSSARGLVTWTQGHVYVTPNSGSLQRGIDAASAGHTVNVAAGTYVQTSTLNVNKSVKLAGVDQATTFIDARGVNSYGMQVSADDVTLQDFTLYGPSANFASAYGIKVSPSSSNANARLRNFTITRVTSRGAGKAELDLNGVDGALIDQVTLNGALVGNDSSTSAGAGLQLTDSANVTVRNSRTLNNAWGGLAIYQANIYYNQQVSGIQVESNNQFAESNPLYMQDLSALYDFGTLTIAGFGYAVRNAASAGSSQYTWLQAGKQQALDFAVNVPDAGTNLSTVQEWNGAVTTQNFQVGFGNLSGGGTRALSVATAVNRSASGGRIAVDTGSYNETVVLGSQRDLQFSSATLQGLTLQSGAANSGIGGQLTVTGSITADAAVRLLSDTTLSTTGGNISLNGQVSNDGSTPRALSLLAGSGSVRGDVSMASGGAAGNPLGTLQVRARNYNLGSTLRVRGYTIDALGNAALSNTTLVGSDAAASNQVTAGGNVTGTVQGPGAVALQSGGSMTVNVSGSQVSLQSQGQLTALVNAGALSVRAGQPVAIDGTAGSLTIDAPSGSVNGTFGNITNTGKGVLTVNGRAEVNEEVKKVEPARIIPVVVVPPAPVFQAAPPPPPPAPTPVSSPAPAPAPAAQPSGSQSSGAQQPADQTPPADKPAAEQQPAGQPAASRVALTSGPAPVAPVVVSTAPKAGGAVMDRGQSVELDLSPGRNSDQK